MGPCACHVAHAQWRRRQQWTKKYSDDGRHDHLTLLETRALTNRIFFRWAMARVSEDGESDIPLIAHVDGISPAAGNRATPEQESVLAFMREATKAAHTQF